MISGVFTQFVPVNELSKFGGFTLRQLSSAGFRQVLVLLILTVSAAATIRQALAPDLPLRDALRGDRDGHLNSARAQLSPIDAWSQDVSRGDSIAMRFYAVSSPTENHRMAAAKFYQRATYVLYSSRVYVTAT